MRKRRIIRIAEGQGSNNRILVAFQKYVQMLTFIEFEISLFEEIVQSTSKFVWSLSLRLHVHELSNADKIVRAGKSSSDLIGCRNAQVFNNLLGNRYQFK